MISTGYDPHEPCVPLSKVAWSVDVPLVDPAWRTATVLALAHAIRADRAMDRLPILADALEEAGCDNLFVLNHCRFCETHDRNCWVVSAVLRRPAGLQTRVRTEVPAKSEDPPPEQERLPLIRFFPTPPLPGPPKTFRDYLYVVDRWCGAAITGGSLGCLTLMVLLMVVLICVWFVGLILWATDGLR